MNLHKGQIVTIDAYIGVAIFIFIFTIAGYTYVFYSQQITGQNLSNKMQEQLLSISDLLMNFPGNFSDWNTSCNPTILGFGKNGQIEYGKLAQIGNASCISYQKLKRTLGSDFEFYLEAKNVTGGTNTSAGLYPLNSTEKVTVRRIGLINNVTYFFDFTLWRV